MALPIIGVKRLHPDAKLPVRATDGALCFDVFAMLPDVHPVSVVTEPEIFDTGLAFEFPPGWGMLVFSRSGHGFKRDVRLANCVGVIDTDYKGELKVKLTPDGVFSGLVVNDGDAIAQVLFIELDQFELREVTEQTTSARGTGGFGSTDRKTD